jgi:hypothetical protein
MASAVQYFRKAGPRGAPVTKPASAPDALI